MLYVRSSSLFFRFAAAEFDIAQARTVFNLGFRWRFRAWFKHACLVLYLLSLFYRIELLLQASMLEFRSLVIVSFLFHNPGRLLQGCFLIHAFC